MTIFFNYTVKSRYCLKKVSVISAMYWIAMCEAASLRVTQQRIINKFLTSHFGKRIVESEKKIAQYNNDYMPYEMFPYKYKDGRQITLWYRSLSAIIQFCMKKLNDSIL